jgi:hypothetical protein
MLSSSHDSKKMYLKRQCQEMVFKMSPCSSSLGLSKHFVNPFFSFKNRPFEIYGPWSSTPIYVKSGTLDPADFATTQIPIRLFFVAYRGTSLHAAIIGSLVFTHTATTLKHQILVGANVAQTWQKAENLPQWKTNFYGAFCRNTCIMGPNTC